MVSKYKLELPRELKPDKWPNESTLGNINISEVFKETGPEEGD